MIKIENLGFSIDGNHLLKNISATFKPGEISMVVGPNGAGKSTLIKLLSQQLSATDGSVHLAGSSLLALSKSTMATCRAVLSQSIELAFPLTVKEVIMMGRYPHFSHHPSQNDENICRQAINFFEVQNFINRNYLTLSGGEKQRVQFARVAAQIWPDSTKTTKYLLLDEPLSHLDIYYQYDFMGKLEELMQQQKMVVIGVVHDLNLAYRYAHQVLLLHKGALLASGTPHKVFSNENMQEAFLMKPSFLENEKGQRFLCF